MDGDALAAYEAGIEWGRLRAGLGLIEFARTRELLRALLPGAPAVVCDIGGGYGEYAYYLASLGYTAHLFDLAARNIELAGALADSFAGVTLASAQVADARSIPMPDASADAVLLMGPLYHLTDRQERLRALRESLRLLRPGGTIFCSALTRYATTLWAMTSYGAGNRLLEDEAFMGMLMRELTDGQHIQPEGGAYTGFKRAFFHLPEELRGELTEAGFAQADVRGVIGCGWLAPDIDAAWKNERARQAILRIVRATDRDESVLGLSTHLLAIARKTDA